MNFAYGLNNPSRYIDPSGHRACESRDGYECDWKTPYLWDRAESILKRLGGKNDLEAMAKIVEAGARVYKDFDTLLPALSAVFLGVEASGPGTLWAAAQSTRNGGGCAGVGRDPRDCSSNEVSFTDTGFHLDFRDFHNQIFHLWGYIANTASPGDASGGLIGLEEAVLGNIVHEYVQSVIANMGTGDSLGWGTSWNDFVLSEAGMEIGVLITNQAITPSELAGVIRDRIGSNGLGSNGVLQVYENQYGPLYGTLHDWQ